MILKYGFTFFNQGREGVISVTGAMIFAKQPLSDDVLVMLPGVKNGVSDVTRLIHH